MLKFYQFFLFYIMDLTICTFILKSKVLFSFNLSTQTASMSSKRLKPTNHVRWSIITSVHILICTTTAPPRRKAGKRDHSALQAADHVYFVHHYLMSRRATSLIKNTWDKSELLADTEVGMVMLSESQQKWEDLAQIFQIDFLWDPPMLYSLPLLGLNSWVWKPCLWSHLSKFLKLWAPFYIDKSLGTQIQLQMQQQMRVFQDSILKAFNKLLERQKSI